jgi:dolichyl-phosphate beta-glucosyltransferase
MTAHSSAELKLSNVVALFPAPVPATNRTAIVVPCFNEEKRLDLEAFSEFLHRVPGIRMVFVNDGSHDGTVEVLETLHAVHPDRVEILSLSRNSGKAEAVRQGLVYAAGSGYS